MTRGEMINMLTGHGANRWTKGNNDRLYLGKAGAAFGFEIVERYGASGRISAAKLDGDFISNSYAAEIDDELRNMYIDLNSMQIGYNSRVRTTVISDRVQEMLDNLNDADPDASEPDTNAYESMSDSDLFNVSGALKTELLSANLTDARGNEIVTALHEIRLVTWSRGINPPKPERKASFEQHLAKNRERYEKDLKERVFSKATIYGDLNSIQELEDRIAWIEAH